MPGGLGTVPAIELAGCWAEAAAEAAAELAGLLNQFNTAHAGPHPPLRSDACKALLARR